jgi:hypothetical protein
MNKLDKVIGLVHQSKVIGISKINNNNFVWLHEHQIIIF